MLVIPAVDIRDGACVQLVGGSYERERLRIANPSDAVRNWEACGFRQLHLVDLDAATGRGANRNTVRTILSQTTLETQVGGGFREADAIEEVLAEGAERVLLGTRAVEDQDWLSEISHSYPGAIIVCADVRERLIVTNGWQRVTKLQLIDFIEELAGLQLSAILVTAVHREGQLGGCDLTLMEDAVEASPFPVMAAGGIGSASDLRALENRGVAATVVGTALYTGALDPRMVAGEFCE
jgi:phosphoribosylformimino-5-aminoimidazole carboxamide ribotide isomerase